MIRSHVVRCFWAPVLQHAHPEALDVAVKVLSARNWSARHDTRRIPSRLAPTIVPVRGLAGAFAARGVLCWPTFPLVSALGSTGSTPLAPLCSSASSLLWGSHTFPGRASWASAPRLPDADQCSTPQRGCGRLVRSPGSRARSVRTCRGLRPRRAGWALALACLPVLPSGQVSNSVGTGMRSFSRLNSSAYAIPCQRFAGLPLGCLRMTRGRCGSLLLHRGGTPHPLLPAGLPAH